MGRIDGPWVNFTPPIRGGIFRSECDIESSSEDEDDLRSSLGSLNSSRTSLALISDSECPTIDVKQSTPSKAARQDIVSKDSLDVCKQRRPRDIGTPRGPDHPSPEEYTASVIQREIDHDVQEFPSLDAETQRKITLK